MNKSFPPNSLLTAGDGAIRSLGPAFDRPEKSLLTASALAQLSAEGPPDMDLSDTEATAGEWDHFFNFSHEQVRHGMSLTIVDANLPQNIPYSFPVGGAGFAFVISLVGRAEIACRARGTAQQTPHVAIEPGELVLSCASCEATWSVVGTRYQGAIVLLPQRAVASLDALEEGLPAPLAEALEPSGLDVLWKQKQADIQLRCIARQIFSCTMKGMSKRLFYESKLLEIAAIFFEKIRGLHARQCSFSSIDIESIYAARNVLIKRMDNPPSLQELSRECGINEFKLKKGFRLYFNQSVFETLRKERMNKAKKLISEQSYSVSHAASEVGYSSLSRFISAFKNEFGVTPGTLMPKVNR